MNDAEFTEGVTHYGQHRCKLALTYELNLNSLIFTSQKMDAIKKIVSMNVLSKTK